MLCQHPWGTAPAALLAVKRAQYPAQRDSSVCGVAAVLGEQCTSETCYKIICIGLTNLHQRMELLQLHTVLAVAAAAVEQKAQERQTRLAGLAFSRHHTDSYKSNNSRLGHAGFSDPDLALKETPKSSLLASYPLDKTCND